MGVMTKKVVQLQLYNVEHTRFAIAQLFILNLNM